MNHGFHRLLVFAAVLGFTLFDARPVSSSPNPAKYVEQSFLGANATHWFYFELIRDFPASYYEHTETLRVCSHRKADGALVDSTVVSQVRHHVDLDNGRPLPNEPSPTSGFDLAGYVRRHDIHLAGVAEFDHSAAVDSGGIYFEQGKKHIDFIKSPEIWRQLPEMKKFYAPVIRNAFRVVDSWNREPGWKRRAEDWYFVVDLGRTGSDASWGRYVVYARRPLPANE